MSFKFHSFKQILHYKTKFQYRHSFLHVKKKKYAQCHKTNKSNKSRKQKSTREEH